MQRRSCVCLLAVVVALTAPATASAASLVSQPEPGRARQLHGVLPSCPPGVSLVCAAAPAASGALGLVGDVAGAGADAAADAVLDGIVGWAADGATWLVRAVAVQIERSTRPALGSAWFSKRYSAMRQLAISLSLIFLLISIAQAALRRDLEGLIRACLVSLPVAMLLTFAAVTLVEVGLALTDELTATALRGSGTDVREGVADLGGALKPGGTGAGALPGLVLLLGALLTAVLALVVWIELVLREAAIYVAVVFLPIALAGLTWRNTAHWARRLAEWLVAIILSKLAIAVAFAVAGSMLGEGRSGSGGLSTVIAGCAVLLIAACTPWVLLQLIPFAEQAAGGLHRSQVRGAVTAVPGAGMTPLLVQQAMFRSFGAAAVAGTQGRSGGSAQRWTPPTAGRSAAATEHPKEQSS